MGREVIQKAIKAAFFCPKVQCQVTWYAQTCSGTTQPPSHWCWKILVIHVQIRTCSYNSRSIWRVRSNRIPIDSRMPITLYPQKISWIADPEL